MADAARTPEEENNLRLGADESGARPIWKHLDELEGGTPTPLSARERADVDALLREIGGKPNPALQPPVLGPTSPEFIPGRRFLEVPAFTLTILGAVAFMFGMFATVAALEWNRAEVREEMGAMSSGKVVADQKPVVVLQLPPFTITGQLPSDVQAPSEASAALDTADLDAMDEAPAASAAATWRPPQLAPADAPPLVTPMGVATPATEPTETLAFSEADDAELDAVIEGLAAPAPSEMLGAPVEAPEQHAMFTPPVPISMP